MLHPLRTPAYLVVSCLLSAPALAQRRPAAAARASAAGAAVPRVGFAVTPLLDEPCAKLTGAPADTAAASELRARLPEFRALWASQGPALLRAATEVTGRPFSFHETLGALHVCPALANLSLPLSFSMRRYMRTPPAGELADSTGHFPAVVFHELLHRYVDDIIGASGDNTPLLRKYAAEPGRVRFHLHLMAVEAAAYRRLKRDRELASVRTAYLRWPSYKRAQEIVDAEGADAFLAELRTAPPVPPSGH